MTLCKMQVQEENPLENAKNHFNLEKKNLRERNGGIVNTMIRKNRTGIRQKSAE